MDGIVDFYHKLLLLSKRHWFWLWDNRSIISRRVLITHPDQQQQGTQKYRCIFLYHRYTHSLFLSFYPEIMWLLHLSLFKYYTLLLVNPLLLFYCDKFHMWKCSIIFHERVTFYILEHPSVVISKTHPLHSSFVLKRMWFILNM